MNAVPLSYIWDGEAFRVEKRFHRLADNQFVIGESYLMSQYEDRSAKSHSHQFAWLAEAWKNLPDDMIERWPTPEHLRKYALIGCGFATNRQFVASSKAEALRIAAFLRPKDEYAVVIVHECVVNEWTAVSQSRKAMGAVWFQRSKQAVLEFVAGLIGVPPETLSKEAGRAA